MNADNIQCGLDYRLSKDLNAAEGGCNDGTSEFLMDLGTLFNEVGSTGSGRMERSGGITEDPGGNDSNTASGGSARRRMRRIPPKYYRIGELVEYAGVSRQTIHNYATMGLLQEAQWTKGGHRLFGQEAFERLAEIAEMKAQNRSMQDIREYFRKLDTKESLDSA